MFTLFQHCHHSFKGFAAVTGIISIVLLQLGFTIFLRTADIFEQSAVIVKHADVSFYPLESSSVNSVAELSPAEFEPRDQIGDRVVSIRRSPFRTETASYRKTPVKRQFVARSTKKPTKLVPRVHFSDTIINVSYFASQPSKHSRYEQFSEERPIPRPSESSKKTTTDRRSFVASVLPIVKKPYGWMKAIGSKLF